MGVSDGSDRGEMRLRRKDQQREKKNEQGCYGRTDA